MSFERYFLSQHRGVDSATYDAAAFLERLARRTTDVEASQRYAAACPLPGVDPEEYAPKRVELDGATVAVAGIHFRGRSLDFPFVDISLQSAPLSVPESLPALLAPFRQFRPRAIRFWHAEGEKLGCESEDDIVVVAASLESLLAAPPLPNVGRIRLQPDPSLSSYGDYLSTYSADSASPESRESLAECAACAAFFRVLVDDAPAGYIAARPDTYRWWRGWHMVEEVLYPSFRGQGLAPAMQQAFLRRLDARREVAVFGTISAKNAASLKTALRVGRRIVEVGTFVPVTTQP
ncbi:MAG TPA: GNAT family N-acetyltransferase [Polyangiaceae bacterium]|nr:GNAT family N-acetyltransferase [Polyangiaceae bacterium]